MAAYPNLNRDAAPIDSVISNVHIATKAHIYN